MIHSFYFLLPEELSWFDTRRASFDPSDSPVENINKIEAQFYWREKLDVPYNLSKTIFERAGLDISKYNFSCQLNRVRPGDNENDGFHTDHSELSFVIFLNDDYEGGKLELVDGEIDPLRGKLVTLTNNTPHKVQPVTSGERFTIIYFIWTAEKALV